MEYKLQKKTSYGTELSSKFVTDERGFSIERNERFGFGKLDELITQAEGHIKNIVNSIANQEKMKDIANDFDSLKNSGSLDKKTSTDKIVSRINSIQRVLVNVLQKPQFDQSMIDAWGIDLDNAKADLEILKKVKEEYLSKNKSIG